ncbi:MAG: TonB-dependent siderophore receptor [Proteobacteria bacterium]|nr:TonB-dependent siderophore receptor [Pseudomonadota bacterium]
MNMKGFEALVLALAAAPALAQQVPSVPSTELSRMTVSDTADEGYSRSDSSTATKIDIPLIETPASIQVVTRQMLQDQKALTFDQALVNVAGVRASNTGWEENIYLRGFPTSTYFRDGFRIDDPSGLGGTATLSNVESIEVLKGPASILYGRVEPGGIVNIITKQPKAIASYAVEQTAGTWGEYTTTVDATGPLNDGKTVQYSLNLSHHQNELFIDNVWDRRDFVAPSLRWAPDAKTQVTLEASYSRDRTILYQQTTVPYDTMAQQYLWGPRNANPSPYEFDPTTVFIGLNWSREFADGWTVRQRISRHKVDFSTPLNWGTCCGPLFLDGTTWTEGLSTAQLTGWTRSDGTVLDVEGHFNTGPVKHTLLLGGDYYDQRALYDSHYSNSDGPFLNVPLFSSAVPPLGSIPLDPNSFYFTDTSTHSYGLYAQDQIKLPHSIEILGGLRYQHVTTSGTSANGTDLYGGSGLPTLSAPPSDHAVTPRFGVLWLPREQLSIYASYTENFGATNATSTDWQHKPLKPEGAKQLEVGSKTESADGRLSATVAWYDLTKTNVLAMDIAHPDGQGGFFPTTLGQIQSTGVEVTLQGEVTHGWDALVAYSYDRATINVGTSTYPTGTRLPQVPEQMLRLYSTYKFSGGLQGLKIGAGLSFEGSAPGLYVDPDTGASQTNVITNPAYHTVDLMASYEHPVHGGQLTAQLNVRNALDASYRTDSFMYVAPFGYVTYGPPRSLLASVRVEF